jgi:hypothetical protein
MKVLTKYINNDTNISYACYCSTYPETTSTIVITNLQKWEMNVSERKY